MAPLRAKYAGEQDGLVYSKKVRYLNSQERQAYQLTVRDGVILGADGQPFDTKDSWTVSAAGQRKAIFVMDHDGKIYASKHQAVGEFQHSSFLAGAPVAAAGEIEVHDGKIVGMSRLSGHYQPSEKQITNAANHLVSMGAPKNFQVDLRV